MRTSASRRLKAATKSSSRLNPEIDVTPLNIKIDENNVYELTQGCDIIMDAMDNFETRYLLNRASLKHNIPLYSWLGLGPGRPRHYAYPR